MYSNHLKLYIGNISPGIAIQFGNEYQSPKPGISQCEQYSFIYIKIIKAAICNADFFP